MYVSEINLGHSSGLKFKILAPSRQLVPNPLTHDVVSGHEHREVMFDLQKLRGRVYREYAGIAATLLPDGRHWQPLDADSWHIVVQDSADEVVGCARYRRISRFEELICSRAAVALCPESGPVFRSAFEQQLAEARRRGMHFGEASAWALSESARCSTAAVNIVLMSFALAEWLGGGLGLTTASTRHHASSILRRIGGKPLAGLKPYYEPMFDCNIELLQIDVAELSSKYLAKLDEMRAQLRQATICCPFESTEDEMPLHSVPHIPPTAPSQPVLAQLQ